MSIQIKLGDIVLDSNILTPPIKGLGKPNIRTASGNFSGKDGGWISSQFYSTRQIVIDGSFVDKNCANLEAKKQELEALPIRESIPMFVTTFSGDIYYADVYLIDLKIDIEDKIYVPFQLTLLAPDPYLYDAGDGIDPDSGFIIEQINKLVGGGYEFPYILPVVWSAGSTPTSINNTSDVLIYPIITMTGKFTNPRFTNNTTGEFIEIGVTTTTGDIIEIDMKNRTVTLNGGSILPYKTGSWWGLQSGINIIQFESDSGGDDCCAQLKYRIAYEGI